MTGSRKESSAVPGAKTTVEKLMEASGLKKPDEPRQELLELGRQMDQSFKAMMAEADRALRSAQETQQNTEQMFNQLKNFCRFNVPCEMEKSLEKLAEKDFQKSLQPLQEEVRKAVSEIEGCRWKLTDFAWELRLLAGPALTGLLVAVVAFAAMYYLFFSKRFTEMKRYAEWGRKVEAHFETLPAKNRERVFSFYGRP